MSKNTQILEGMSCPKCKHEGPFVVRCEADVIVSDDDYKLNFEFFGKLPDLELGRTKWTCTNCDYRGAERDFSLNGESVPYLSPEGVMADYLARLVEMAAENPSLTKLIPAINAVQEQLDYNP
jgi:hypothetical protein